MSGAYEQLLDRAQGGDAGAQFELGRHYVAQEEFGRARRWFGRAARAGNAQAWSQLGLLELQGLGLAADPADARRHFSNAAAAGDPEGRYQLALMRFRAGAEPDAVLQDLVEVARTGHIPAQRQLGVLHLAEAPETGRAVLAMAASAGDRIARSLLARLCDAGIGGAPDPEAARRWARAAIASGSYCRKRFQPVGADDGEASPPRVDPVSLTQPLLPADLRTPDHPGDVARISVFDGILSVAECEYLMEMAAPRLRPSHTVHPETGAPVHNEMRTSFGCSFHPTEEDFVVIAIKRRLAAQTELPVEHAEPFALLRYEIGQEYKAHWDYIDPRSGEAGREIGRFGQRRVTIFSYLTDVARGGETEFVRRDIRVAPRQGRALMFHNTLDNGEPDPDSLHASLPVEDGEKWIATLWMREKVMSR